jgi:hypothetical protein
VFGANPRSLTLTNAHFGGLQSSWVVDEPRETVIVRAGAGFGTVARTVAAGPRPAEFSAVTVIRYATPFVMPLSVAERLPPPRDADLLPPPEAGAQVTR